MNETRLPLTEEGQQNPFVKPGDFDAGRYISKAETSLAKSGRSYARVLTTQSTLVYYATSSFAKEDGAGLLEMANT